MERVFEWLSDDVGRTPEDCASLFSTWKVRYHEERGVRAAAALLKGQEIHFVVAPEWRRRLIRRDNATAFLTALLHEAGGMLTTRILHGSAGPARFVERIGFEKTWSDERFDFYALCRAPFQRRHP
jgi:hypothetical protein